MEPWKGMETADITYNDTEGIFTRFLREKGYLQPDIWENARPMYYLEVKTTTKDYDTRFFVSKAQYKRVSHLDLFLFPHQPIAKTSLTMCVR
jgi:hypothetical protein